jgi:choice-of-anchor A domain-containing protein
LRLDLTSGAIDSLTIGAPAGATVVINVPGAGDSFSNGPIAYTGGATAADAIFNFSSATTLTTGSTTVYGSILAPLATFTGSNSSSVNGELIAAAVTNDGAEFESADIFQGNLGSVATPEPSSWILMSGALVGFAAFGVRRRTPGAK